MGKNPFIGGRVLWRHGRGPFGQLLAAALLALALLAGCGDAGLEKLRARGTLRLATLNQPTSYYLGAHGPEGFDFRLAEAFARELGLQLVVVPARDLAALRRLVATGQADLVAAQITADSDWRHAGLATQTYHEEPQLVVQRRGHAPTHNIAELVGARLVVRSASPQLLELQQLRKSGQTYLSWTELPRETADPLDWISTGDADYAIVDEAEFRFARHLYPEVVVAFALPDPRPLHWLVRRSAPDLREAADRFLADSNRTGLLASLDHAAEPEGNAIAYEAARRFQDDIGATLPTLKPLFEHAANESNVDWRLLAAVGYQESHWESGASSANGAVGIMMLTAETARTVGVTDRHDAAQSIRGGASYLAQVLQMIPARIAEPDRTWLALAAYNVGFGHLEDARVLTQASGHDPDKWEEVSRYLPLLAEERYYAQARRGYARGWEPVLFVEQVKGFLAVLEWFGGEQAARTASAATAGKEPI
jgi:membrane-bound lytic murein transglycosylase F